MKQICWAYYKTVERRLRRYVEFTLDKGRLCLRYHCKNVCWSDWKFQKYLFRRSTAEIHGCIENSWRIDNKLYASKWKHCSNGDSQECNISPIRQEIINNGCKILLSQKLGGPVRDKFPGDSSFQGLELLSMQFKQCHALASLFF